MRRILLSEYSGAQAVYETDYLLGTISPPIIARIRSESPRHRADAGRLRSSKGNGQVRLRLSLHGGIAPS